MTYGHHSITNTNTRINRGLKMWCVLSPRCVFLFLSLFYYTNFIQLDYVYGEGHHLSRYSFFNNPPVGIFLFYSLLFLPSSHQYPSVSTECLLWLLTHLLFHFIITSHAHLMAIWPFLPISFLYVKELVTHSTPQCLFSHWGVSSFVIWLLLSLLIYSSISTLLLGTTNILSVCSPTEVISILLLVFQLPCFCYTTTIFNMSHHQQQKMHKRHQHCWCLFSHRYDFFFALTWYSTNKTFRYLGYWQWPDGRGRRWWWGKGQT